MTERLQRVLAEAGIGSRRRCEELIRQGVIWVNGEVAHLGMKVDPEKQTITVSGRPIRAQAKEYWLLNKPHDVVSTARDPQGRKTVVDCVPSTVRVFPVGRLDRNTTGVLVLTNDGDLAYRLLHPSFGVEKEYRVTARGRVSSSTLERLREGVELEDGVTASARVELISQTEERTELSMVIHEGRKRQIRRMLDAVGHPVLYLHRSRFDGVSDKDLAIGQARRLSGREIQALRRASSGSAGNRDALPTPRESL